MPNNKSTPQAKKPRDDDKTDNDKVLEVVSVNLFSDRLAPGGYVIHESQNALDRRELPFPRWRCNECHWEFPTAALRDAHEEESMGVSYMGPRALLEHIPASSRQAALESFINSPRRYKHEGFPPASKEFRIPYEGTEEASVQKSTGRK
ncbi:hypothetical protein BJX64DRAFT_279868 [Aspergillus heterothallicus]